MKSRGLQSSEDAADRGTWARRVILGGLGTAGATVALAAFAASAFANAANPLPDAHGTITPLGGGSTAVRVDVGGTWNWGELSGSSVQKSCAGRSGVAWSVDWWGLSGSKTAKAITDGQLTGTQVNPVSNSATPPSGFTGNLDPVANFAWASTGGMFHTSHLFNGFDADLCKAPNHLDAQGFPEGPWSASATYPSAADVPAQLCVNFYDPHGQEGKYSTSTSDNFANLDGDNSIKTNAFDPTLLKGYCFTPQFALSMNVDKNNDANKDGTFSKTEQATVAGQDVNFQVTVTNTSAVDEVIDSVTDQVPTGAAGHAVTCVDSANKTVVGQTIAVGKTVTCTFTESNYAPANGSLTDKAVVTVHEAGNTANTLTDSSESTVTAPPAQAHLAANIELCSDPNAVLPNDGSLVTSGGPTTVAAAKNALASTKVDPGTYKVTATAPTGFHLVVCGNYDGSSFQSATLANGDSKTLNFFVAPNGSPLIDVTKTGPATGTAGSTGTYTVTIKNIGTATAHSPISFVDQLPAGETFASATGTDMVCTAAAANAVNCTYSGNDLAVNDTASVAVTVTYAAGTEGKTLTDCVGTTNANAQPGVARPGDQCVPTKILEPKLTITKTGPDTGVPGGSGSYTITVTNNGAGPATTVTFVDKLPAKETFVSASGDFKCTPDANDPTKINCEAKSGTLPLAAGDSLSVNVLVTYALTSVEGDQLQDCAILPSLDKDCKTTLIHTPDLTINKTGPATGVAGDQGKYTIVVKNTGKADANNVSFQDVLPDGETFVSASGAFTCVKTANPQVVNCTLNGGGTLAPGASASVDVTVTYDLGTDGKTLTDCAVLAPDNQSCVPTKIPGKPSITVVKTNDADGDGVFHDSETAKNPGDAVTFKVVITNTSADPIALDSISDAFDATTLAECPTLLNTVLNNGDSVTCTFTVANYAPAAGSSLTDTVTVGGHQVPGGTPVSGSDTSTVNTRKPPTPGPDLAIVKTADKDTVKIGDTLTYTLSVSNVGDGPTTGTVAVFDTVPAGLDLVSVDGGTAWDCTVSGQTITCDYNGGVVNPGDVLPDITVVTKVNSAAAVRVVNTGIVNTPGDTNPLNDRSTVKTPLTTVLPFKVTKPPTPVAVLPFTGDRTGQMLPVGLTAVLFGLMLMVIGRRRRRA